MNENEKNWRYLRPILGRIVTANIVAGIARDWKIKLFDEILRKVMREDTSVEEEDEDIIALTMVPEARLIP